MGSASSVLWKDVPVAVAAPPDCTVSPVWTEAAKDRLEPLMVRAAPDWTARPAEPVKDRLEPLMVRSAPDWTARPAEPVKDRLEPLMVRSASDWTVRPAEPVKDRLEPAAIERVPLTVTEPVKDRLHPETESVVPTPTVSCKPLPKCGQVPAASLSSIVPARRSWRSPAIEQHSSDRQTHKPLITGRRAIVSIAYR